ncbi:MAG: tRNA glutamyl-Q(34) synthetase GluQRS [Myxococcales bacterium]|nr:tRNA glutamyl-Q(34) synthetase GluQRS [Myxococcales bacterium]
MPERSAPVGRLAPSPTGQLHLGHARSFLLAWWSVRSRAGRVVLRLEDLDAPRVRPGMVEAAVRDLEWLGLDWDGPMLLQSAGMERLRAAVSQLSNAGLTYPCVCSRADVRAALGAPQQGDVEQRYPGTCRDRFDSIETASASTGREVSLRFRVPEGALAIADAFAAPAAFDVQAEVGDFMVARRDGTPAYQLAVVVDDAFQEVTEVLRGDDLLPSAARQAHLQRALGLAHPSWVHVPLVVDASGRRFAKRADDLSLAELRARGVDPRALVGWAARASGLDVPERISPREALAEFSLAKLPHEPVRLDPKTLAKLKSAR